MSHENELREIAKAVQRAEAKPIAIVANTPPPGTIAADIAEYKATRDSSPVKLLRKVLDQIIGLKCPHCGKDVNITIED